MAGGPPFLALVEDYNGTAWTEVGDLNTARQKPFAAKNGTPTAALCYGGGPPGTPGAQAIAITESYNGTTWTEVADLGTARYGGGGAGIQTDALCIGGGTGPTRSKTESFNGTAWTEENDLGSSRYGNTASAGTGSLAFTAGTQGVPRSITEEWTKAATVKTVTVT